jgi:FkbM family methyltransferase
LFTDVPESKFKDKNGNWYRAGGDVAMFYNVIEQVDPSNVVCVPDVVYVYNDANPLNDYKVNAEEQNATASDIIEGDEFIIQETRSTPPVKISDVVDHVVEHANKILQAMPPPTPTDEPEPTALANSGIREKAEMNPTRVLIAIPTAKNIEAETFKSIYNLEIPTNTVVQFEYFYGYNVDQVRNLIADWTVKGFDYVFCVDSDITFPPDTLAKLLNQARYNSIDIISGVYRTKTKQFGVELYDENYQQLDFGIIQGRGTVPIGACGFGCVLVSSEILERVGYPQFDYHRALNHNDTLSEDVDFCMKAWAKGAAVFCDTTVLCGHIGNKTFNILEQSTPLAPLFGAPMTQGPELSRLKQLRDQPLLPKRHVDFLQYMSNELHIKPKVIYDIGACVLHWTRPAKKAWPDAEIIAFEAMEECAPIYEEEGMQYYTGVLSDSNEKLVEFYKNVEHPGGNSYYKENPELSPKATEIFSSPPETFETDTLDFVVHKSCFPPPDLIKMDIQGAELDVLRGATETLKSCQHLILELQHKDYNLGAPKAEDVIKEVVAMGFELVQKIDEGVLGVDADYYFRRVL